MFWKSMGVFFDCHAILGGGVGMGRVSRLWVLRSKRCYNLDTAATAKSLQWYPTLCDPIDSSPSGSSIPGILQARTLEWVAISFSNAWKWKVKVKSLSHVRLLATPWTTAYQVPRSMGFSRQESWSVVPMSSPKHAYTLSYHTSCIKIIELHILCLSFPFSYF